MFHRSRSFREIVAIVACLSTLGGIGRADDWPQWRGPDRDGTWKETGVIESFAAPQLKPRWSAPVGPGYSGPTVAGDRVFVTDRVAAPEEQERVLCFDRLTGKQLWSHGYPCAYRNIDYALGPRAAVSVHDGRAFALGAMGHLHCLDTMDGRLLWNHDLAAEVQADIPIWGISAAPLVYKDLVIVQIGGRPDACVIAFDAATGKERWRALDGRASYSAPRLIKQDDRAVALAWTGQWFAGLDPATGNVLWKQPYKPNRMVINVPDPVLDAAGGRVFLSAFYDGSHLFRLGSVSSAPELLWRRQGVSERNTDALHCMISTPVIIGEHVYGIDSYGEFRCLSLADGARVWTDESLLENGRWATAYLVQNGERTWISTERGELIIARLTPKGFERISSARYLSPTTMLRPRRYPITWSHPAYAHRHLFARSDTELICISLEAGSD